MRIAYLTGTYPRATDTFIQREVSGLRAHGVDVHTFAVRCPDDRHIVGPEQEKERSHTTYILPPNLIGLLGSHLRLAVRSPHRYFSALKLAKQTSQPGLKGALYQLFYFIEAGILATHIQRRALAHLHNHFGNTSCSVAMLAATMGGFTYSTTLHGPAIFFEPHRWRIDEKIRRASFVACISHYCRSQAMVFADYSHWDKLKIIHCGVDPSQFTPVRHQGQGTRLLFVGRLAAVKGLPVLLESLRQLRETSEVSDLHLTVIGDGPDRSMLEAQTASFDLATQVEFVGYQSQSAVRNYLQQTDVFVLPSFAEGVPVVLMEALMSGVPVVATQIAGVSELVSDGETGFLVPPSDAVALAEKIQVLLADGEMRQRMGEAGVRVVRSHFDIVQESQKLAGLIAEVTGLETSFPSQTLESSSLENPSQTMVPS